MTTLRFLIVIACCMMQICLMAQERKHIVQSGEDFVSIAEKYGITVDDDATGIRNGGLGSTTGKNV